ncbi:hypothetical protein AAFF_G00200400 [Aldrovandia affinis]|uniref:Uncharacterized protein n=1 Tax=Aldrovandia affinis TaxID=143900 RepID=A0AAD7RI60_9TELE|nr:hypothetical protein AAFF_G00200400 [Aldrovandia affinis]
MMVMIMTIGIAQVLIVVAMVMFVTIHTSISTGVKNFSITCSFPRGGLVQLCLVFPEPALREQGRTVGFQLFPFGLVLRRALGPRLLTGTVIVSVWVFLVALLSAVWVLPTH